MAMNNICQLPACVLEALVTCQDQLSTYWTLLHPVLLNIRCTKARQFPLTAANFNMRAIISLRHPCTGVLIIAYVISRDILAT